MAEQPGLATDASGGPVIDPTANVRELVDAAIKRQDDLREAESRHVREVAALRAEYAGELRATETARIDAIRRVDVEAVQRDKETQAAQATALANQVAAAAEAMRTQVAAAASASVTGLAAALEPIQKDIQDLRKAQYEQQGIKSQTQESRGGLSVAIAAVSAVIALTAIIVVVVIALASQAP